MPTACYNPKTGQYDGISTAYRVKLASAFVVDPDKPMDIPILVGDLKRKQILRPSRPAMIKGAATRIPQPVPPGTGEAAVPAWSTASASFPARTFSSRRWTARTIRTALAWTIAEIRLTTEAIVSTSTATGSTTRVGP